MWAAPLGPKKGLRTSHAAVKHEMCIRDSVYIEETFIHKQYIYHIRPIKSNTGYFAGSSHIHGTLFRCV